MIAIMIQNKFQYVSISVIFVMLVGAAIIPYSAIAFAQQSQNTTSKNSANTTSSTNATGAMTNKTALLKPGNPAAINVALAAKMLQLLSSNKPKDIAPHFLQHVNASNFYLRSVLLHIPTASSRAPVTNTASLNQDLFCSMDYFSY